MALEIFYCARCCYRILSEDFERDRAYWVADRAVCSGCIRRELAALPPQPGRPPVLRRSRRIRVGGA